MQRPTQWPDGRKLGGLNGYPPEYFEWARECQVKFVALQMLLAPVESRSAVFEQWKQKFAHVTREKVSAVWDEVANRKTALNGEANG
jgi:hypothetical protein